MKYNYKKASEIYKAYFDTFCDCWNDTKEEIRKERRTFMRSLTRLNKSDIDFYIKFALQVIEEMRPIEDAKSRCYDFEYEREAEKIIDDIRNFVN